jgi:class 3 adenylate cyclase/tetratricopeptide (TPR) repeat protein
VPTCTSCGHEVAAEAAFRFCPRCGSRLEPVAVAREVRKTVTVLFCDVTGSTALGERTDPEALRGLLARYFERMKAIVESHGGTVEKFIGDAVMAVFGVPAAHEDDALRACRAAMEMRAAFPELGINGRIGVNTGEVVAGTEERLATGDAVNIAARLEQAAQPGELLIGEETLALVRDAVVTEVVEPLALKGKAQPVPAFRLLAVPGLPERSHTAGFVGRARELSALVDACARALAQSSCELVTVVGEAGVGKSRLVAEALDGIEVSVVRGRCLPYGDGITYWPVVEVVKQLDTLPSDKEAAGALRSLLGESDRPTSADEIAWAFRKLLEEQAPLVVCLDDLQWGEETFLDLVESTALLARDAPLLLLCMARPELLERRPSWPSPLRLEPLGPDDTHALIGRSLPEDVRRQIADRAGGNPLFITEMLALATDGAHEVPPTLKALLAARLDQIEEAERRVLERGAVEGELFHRGGVQALSPEDSEVLPRLAALVRHELIRPERPQFPGEDGFRFCHLLIRDAAYDALPKAVRADLHRRFADWIEEKRTLVELDELAGYHLEQAARYCEELGQSDPSLALRAGDRLVAAGQRANDRDDVRAAAGLLERSLSLTRPLRCDVHAELELAAALLQEPARGARICRDAAARAARAGDETGEALARAMAVFYSNMSAPTSADELETLLLDARRRLEELEDHAGLAQVWWGLGFGVANMRGRADDWATASIEAHRHRRLAGRSSMPPPDLGAALLAGSRPTDEVLAILDRQLAETPSVWLQLNRAWLLAMLDRVEEARQIALEANARLREQDDAHWGEWMLAEISTLGGDHEDASNRLRTLCQWLEAMEQLTFLENYLGRLGRSLCKLGRFDDAERAADRARSLEKTWGGSVPDYLWREVMARVHAHRGDLVEAERLAREAVQASELTDQLDDQCHVLCALAEVLATAGRLDEATAALEQALDGCQRKKNLAFARQIRQRLEELRAEGQESSLTSIA